MAGLSTCDRCLPMPPTCLLWPWQVIEPKVKAFLVRLSHDCFCYLPNIIAGDRAQGEGLFVHLGRGALHRRRCAKSACSFALSINDARLYTWGEVRCFGFTSRSGAACMPAA